MGEPAATPYGEWPSPITASMLATAARRLEFPTLVGDEVWWCEDRPAEGGRTTVMARRAGGEVVEVLPAPWSARSRVHEYGGRAFLAVPGPTGPALVFVNFADQRLCRLDPGAGRPVPLTPVPATPAGLRYADLVLVGDEIWCVRERHRPDALSGGGAQRSGAETPDLAHGDLDRHIVAVPLDGRPVREIVGGSRFLANPRVSPDGSQLAWLAWDHPRMPWDGTELRVGSPQGGRVTEWSTVLGGPAESVCQPEWDDQKHLLAVSDRTGWWNLYRVPAPGVAGNLIALCPAEEEFGAPLWVLGAATYGRLADGRVLCVHGTGSQRLGVLDPATGELSDLDLPYQTFTASLAVSGRRAVVVAGGPATPNAVVAVDPDGGRVDVVRTATDPQALPDPAWLPIPESTVLPGPGGREVHAHIYPPRNPEHAGPPGTLPPYVVFVHGGPTSHSPATLDLGKAYFTSRGIGVLDVNYGGSTGYGRAYRQQLVGQWGVVDVEDCAAAAAGLAARGYADPDLIAIRGGSAGGWTVLCAVTGTDRFAAGVSLYGVGDADRLAEITHDFEARYVPELTGGDRSRSPLHRADRSRCPVLLLQGADDPIVPPEQAVQFRDALAAAGVPHRLIVFPGERHGFRKAETIAAVAVAELAFYGQVLGFTPPGIPPLTLSIGGRYPTAHG